MKISRILHAGYIFESAGVRIAFDPILETPFSTNCYAFPEVRLAPPPDLAFDAVFLSHFHDDHCSLTSLARLDRRTPLYLYCVHEELFVMIRALGFASVTPLIVGEAVSVGETSAFRVTPLLALDPDVDTFFSIEGEGLRVLNIVDAWIDPSEFDRLVRAKWDLVLWPFQTMLELDALMPLARGDASRELPPEWLEQIALLAPRFVVPSSCQFRFESWSWLNARYFPITYSEFARAVKSVVRLNPGETFELSDSQFSRVGRLDWITPVGDQDVDYYYEPSAPPESMREIATRFPSLCESQLIELRAFTARFPLRVWCADGTSFGPGPTEIPAYKLWRALHEGETLTSLYLRTPDVDTDPLIAELSRDPLCFQRAQLRRLLGSRTNA